MSRFISGLSILFHESSVPFLCQYHTVLMIVVLYNRLRLESGSLIPPAVFLSQDCFCYLTSFVFPYKLKFFSSSMKNAIGNLIGVELNV